MSMSITALPHRQALPTMPNCHTKPLHNSTRFTEQAMYQNNNRLLKKSSSFIHIGENTSKQSSILKVENYSYRMFGKQSRHRSKIGMSAIICC